MLVPLMLSPDLEATSKTSEHRTETILKPQLHTQKNHSSYNGTRTLPIATRVRRQNKPPTLDPDSQTQDNGDQKRKSKRRSKLRRTEDESPLYEVTLYYPHNRACTIYRSREDFWLLRTGISSRSSSAAPQPLSTPPSDGIKKCEDETKEVAKWDSLLRKGLERFAKNGHGRYSVEWFLRRRLGDCERMVNGQRTTGLPGGTTRRMKVKQHKTVDDTTTTTDERSREKEDRIASTDKPNDEAAATEEKCLHDTDEEEEEDIVISIQSQTDDENEAVEKGESIEDKETTSYNNNQQPDQEQEQDEAANDNPNANESSPKPARRITRRYTEERPVLDPIVIKPIPAIRELQGSSCMSMAKRRLLKNKQLEQEMESMENTTRRIGCVVLEPSTVEKLEGYYQSVAEAWVKNEDEERGLDSIIRCDATEYNQESSSEEGGTVVLTPTTSSASGSAGEMSPLEVAGEAPPNPALMYKVMFSRRASSGSDWQQKIRSLHERGDGGTNTL